MQESLRGSFEPRSGEHALALMDRLAFIVASRFARKPVVTAATDKVEFLAPVKEGNLIELIGRVTRVGRTSITVDIEMYTEDLLPGDRRLCTTGRSVMVAVDGDGRPMPVASDNSPRPDEETKPDHPTQTG